MTSSLLALGTAASLALQAFEKAFTDLQLAFQNQGEVVDGKRLTQLIVIKLKLDQLIADQTAEWARCSDNPRSEFQIGQATDFVILPKAAVRASNETESKTADAVMKKN